jgi:hypothetical protein
MRHRQWVHVGRPPSKDEKAAVGAACERFIAEILKPRFLPAVIPHAEWNYVVDIRGKWHGKRYRFIQRYRCPEDGYELDAPFAGLEFMDRDRFDVVWHRHTGQWFCLHRGLSLAEALKTIETDGHLHPP